MIWNYRHECAGNAMSLAIWEAIKFTKEVLGLSEFDFCGSMLPGVEHFFRKFGGKLTPFFEISWASKKSLPFICLRKAKQYLFGTKFGKSKI